MNLLLPTLLLAPAPGQARHSTPPPPFPTGLSDPGEQELIEGGFGLLDQEVMTEQPSM